MSQKTEQDSRPIAEAVDLPEISVEHSTEFLTGSAPCAGVSRPLPAAWLGQRGIYRSRLEAVCNGEQLMDPLTLGELIQHAWRYLYLTRRAGLGLKPARQPLTSTTKTPEATDAAVDQMIAEEDADTRQDLTQQAEAERPELWAVHAQGPDELYAAFSREDAEKHAAELNALPMPEGIAVGAVVVPSPWPEAEHWKYLAEQEREHVDVARAGLTQPSPAQAEKAEVERPEVVAWQYRVTAGPQTGWSLWHPGKGEEFERSYTVERRPLMTVAQHDRIVGELRAVIAQLRQHKNDYMDSGQETYRALQNEIREREAEIARLDGLVSGRTAERDAAQARVAKLEHSQSFQRDIDYSVLSEYAYKHRLHFNNLCAVVRSALIALPAQAQHSVPEGFREKFKQCMELAFAEIAYYVSQKKARDPNSRARKAGALATELHAMLAAAPGTEVPQAWLDVKAERRRQVEAEGWTPQHDDEHADGQMAQAAGCYALHAGGIGTDWPDGRQNGSALFWPWDKDWWKPTTPRRDLVKACALALAEIERLDRVAASQGGPSDA
ncbi:hypothetical protein [Pseudomonas aeruginosa]|uniref:hypothetical protein n=1 Tax=Pseudomonas aeruginosa TaxID=287 RepID=UPI0020C72567|nr:hypothetical protein [Pseudomonas aeruginosa]